MPWRKYSPRKGKYGLIYPIDRGISVRQDIRRKWTLFIEKVDYRKSVTFNSGRDGLVKAIKTAEKIVDELKSPDFSLKEKESKNQTPKFNEFSTQWLKNNQAKWDPATQERYEAIQRLHLATASWFNYSLDEITRSDIKVFLRKLLKKRSPRTVESVHTVISGIFNEAIDETLVKGNPATGLLKRILPPKNKRHEKDPEPFTINERRRFEAWAETHCSLKETMLLKVMNHAGLRLGEALAFRIGNLDLNKLTYHVTQSYRQYRFKKPKGSKFRFVDLPKYLIYDLKFYIKRLRYEKLKQGRGEVVDFLFEDPDCDGKWPLSQRKVQRLVERVCKGAKLGRRNPHDLRHTYATITLMAPLSPAYVQKQLGHSSISITVDTYGHWIPGEGRQGLEEALGGGKVVRNRVQKPHIFPYNKKGLQ
jgi:integrase